MNIPDEPDIALHMPYLEEVAFHSPFIIELGCGDGYGSTQAFRKGHDRLKDPLLLSIDLRCDRPKEPPNFFDAKWKVLHGDSIDPNLIYPICREIIWNGGLRRADLIFIDTDHTYEHIAKELPIWEFLSKPETVWLFHDTWMFGKYNRMTDAIKEFAAPRGLVYEDLSKECNGLGRMASKQASLIPYFASGEKGSTA